VGILAGNWSELVQLVVCDLLGIHADPQGVWVKPLLPRPLEWLRATLRWHDRQLDILLERTNVAAPVVLADSHPLPADMAQRWYLPPEAQQVRCLVP
jgi:cellobiose phosphorylase